MAACTSRHGLLCFCLIAAFSVAQEVPRRAGPEKVSLSEVSTVQIPSLPAESIGAPFFCDPDGRIFLRLAMPDTGVEDPVSVSNDGKAVIRFGREKINDIPRPQLESMFLSGSDLYVLTRGSTPLGYDNKLRTPTGETQRQPATKSTMFVARFDRDGRYARAIPLDLPFRPQQLGVFENGDFLISGMASMSQPRVAIVSSNGQLNRFIELKGDVHLQESSNGSVKDKDPTALPRFKPSPGVGESLFDAVAGSRITQDGPNLLLYRGVNGPVFSISPSGEVQVHRLKMDSEYVLYAIKPVRNAWIVEFMRAVTPNEPAVELATFAFDPENGTPLREYFFPADLGWGLACTNGEEFTFIMDDEKTGTLKLAKFVPPAKPN